MLKTNDNDHNNNTDQLIEDRNEQKKLVHPYRKYQLYILIMFILMIILSIILFNQNKKLKDYLKEKDNVLTSLTNIENESKGVKEFYDIVEVNYKYLLRLDERPNIEIIRTPEEIYFLSYLIADDNIITYELCYKSTEDGDSPLAFINKCSNLTPLVFLIETNDGYRFGVYISQFLNYNLNGGKGGYIPDNRAFIFSFDNTKKYPIKKPEYAIYIQPDDFPWFGKKDIFIGKNFAKSSSSFCEFPVAFERNQGDKGDYILNGGIKKFIIKRMEVLSPSIWDFEMP